MTVAGSLEFTYRVKARLIVLCAFTILCIVRQGACSADTRPSAMSLTIVISVPELLMCDPSFPRIAATQVRKTANPPSGHFEDLFEDVVRFPCLLLYCVQY